MYQTAQESLEYVKYIYPKATAIEVVQKSKLR